jgi:hypothetical protein
MIGPSIQNWMIKSLTKGKDNNVPFDLESNHPCFKMVYLPTYLKGVHCAL